LTELLSSTKLDLIDHTLYVSFANRFFTKQLVPRSIVAVKSFLRSRIGIFDSIDYTFFIHMNATRKFAILR